MKSNNWFKFMIKIDNIVDEKSYRELNIEKNGNINIVLEYKQHNLRATLTVANGEHDFHLWHGSVELCNLTLNSNYWNTHKEFYHWLGCIIDSEEYTDSREEDCIENAECAKGNPE